MARHDDLAGLDRLNAIGNDLDAFDERLASIASSIADGSTDSRVASDTTDALTLMRAALQDLDTRLKAVEGQAGDIYNRLKRLESAAKAPAKPAPGSMTAA